MRKRIQLHWCIVAWKRSQLDLFRLTMTDLYTIVGQNNRNLLVQSKRLAPYHEDVSKLQSFEPASVAPGHWTRVKIDFKHSTDREIILNDIRLQFDVDFSGRAATGKVFAVRGTDLIRELVVKINEDVVFKVDKKGELSFLYMMGGHRTMGEPEKSHDAYIMHAGIIPAGEAPFLKYNPISSSTNKGQWIIDSPGTGDYLTRPGAERFDGRPRLIYDSTNGYKFRFDMSLNQLIGPIFHRLHVRRLEYATIELRFEPWVSADECEDFLLFELPPTGVPGAVLDHPYSKAQFTNIQIRQYRTTLLDGIQGFTLPDSRMLSWLSHRYSRKEFSFDFSNQTFLDIQLHDWEIRTNITRIYWMLAPRAKVAGENDFTPLGEPCEGYDTLCGVEIRWKNDVVLDLATTRDVHRHYALSENKRHGFDDPFITFQRILSHAGRTTLPSLMQSADNTGANSAWQGYVDNEVVWYSWMNWSRMAKESKIHYEFPIYHVDLNMNVMQGVPGAEIIGGIVNDTTDYVIRIKKLSDVPFQHTGVRTLWVFLEYETLVNLAGNSNQFVRGSQVVTKQLNLQ